MLFNVYEKFKIVAKPIVIRLLCSQNGSVLPVRTSKTANKFLILFSTHTNVHLVHYRKVFTSNLLNMADTDIHNKEDLKQRLTPLQYHVTQEKGTERPFTGKFNKTYDKGTYSCVVCDIALFSSDTKFDSGCGWPAFNDVLDQGKVKLTKDTSNGLIRTEVTCSNCGAHLGHVFNDGPPPKRKRFCINSASLEFHPAAVDEKSSA